VRVQKLIECIQLSLKEIKRSAPLKQPIVQIRRVAIHNHITREETNGLCAYGRKQKRQRDRSHRTAHFKYLKIFLI
jgi:hypothetical protein